MPEITAVSVNFSVVAIRHLGSEYGIRLADDPSFIEFMNLLGRAERAFQDLPRVRL